MCGAGFLLRDMGDSMKCKKIRDITIPRLGLQNLLRILSIGRRLETFPVSGF
jgi:hypothetical protein